ncbi:hypothetical protein, partial [Amnibacterium kyonggiense]|uniref:hypothetical protein n=1 Tax=Amnibacterium kyonggiense TaxID=595671 RepID=UPI0031D4678A
DGEAHGMSEYSPDRPYILEQDMALFVATDAETASMYGARVKAAEISNVDYKMRYARSSGRGLAGPASTRCTSPVS